jgi:hypothetical protein
LKILLRRLVVAIAVENARAMAGWRKQNLQVQEGWDLGAKKVVV